MAVTNEVRIWLEDFQMFADTIDEVVTPANEHYAVIPCDKSKRGGGGLSAQAGITIETQVIEVFRKMNNKNKPGGTASGWQVKKVFMTSARDAVRASCHRKRFGVGGNACEAALFFFRGQWAPSSRH